jgi:putative Mg2+ transporter-C (MgtC) family protein
MSFELPNVSLLELLLRLLAALLLGASLGWERERQQKPAGLRTHMLVTLGSASFALLGTEMLDALSPQHARSRIDPTRVIEGIVGGIGFLGAGSIIRSRGNVEGLTTAASVWVAGAIGAACGLGLYAIAVLTSGFALVTLWVVGALERRINPQQPPPGGKPADETGPPPVEPSEPQAAS